ncbi:unnamed protein product, partial [marine sediment metagenome]
FPVPVEGVIMAQFPIQLTANGTQSRPASGNELIAILTMSLWG